MNILMLSTQPGSVDGIRVASYEEGREYDLTGTAGAQELAAAFVGAGLAEEVGAEPTAQAAVAQVEGDSELPPEAAGPDSVPATKPSRKPKAS